MSASKSWLATAQAVTGTFLGSLLGGVGGIAAGIAFSHWPDGAAGKPMAFPFGVVEGCVGFVVGIVVNLAVIGVCGIGGAIAGSLLGTFLGLRRKAEESGPR
jgi:hypothetical protein